MGFFCLSMVGNLEQGREGEIPLPKQKQASKHLMQEGKVETGDGG